MKSKSFILAALLGCSLAAVAQTPGGLAVSHGSTVKKPAAPAVMGVPPELLVPVARVNGAELTKLDLRREMFAIFPYATQHNGFPKDMEPEIRKGAMDMLIFEELLYQDGKRRNLAVAPEKLAKAEKSFRAQFPSQAIYEAVIKTEFHGSKAEAREKIRRSLLIDKMLKTMVDAKSTVTLAEAKAYYERNPKEFTHGETYSIQTISMIPPENATKATLDETKAKITDLHRIALTRNTYEGFGRLAEQLSDDDWKTQMGDRKAVDLSKLPPPVADVVKRLKVGEISNVIQLGNNYVIVRLNAHANTGKTPFAEVQKKLLEDLQQQKKANVRAALNQQLHKTAKVEVL